MTDKILIIDFGSQYTQLIARRVRELNVFSDIVSCYKLPEITPDIKGVILSGSPFSVKDEKAPRPAIEKYLESLPVLGVCYGAQLLADMFGGKVAPSNKREYGKAALQNVDSSHELLKNIEEDSQVWMSHADSILALPENAINLAKTASIPNAAFALNGYPNLVMGIQFHPEVYHSTQGKVLVENFVKNICGCKGDWTSEAYIEATVADIKQKVGAQKVIMGLSGGVDSTVAATLIHRAIGDQLHCIFVDNGLLRKDEYAEVLKSYEGMGLNIKGVDASEAFLGELAGKTDPEEKRKTIGRVFIEVFEKESKAVEDAKWLGQGTIYPDVIESVSVHGPSAKIKSHHNVGGLPEKMGLTLVEPLRKLFKDEVRRVGAALNIDPNILNRHPFPGPGLAVRILGDITADKVKMLQEADAIFINLLKSSGWYDKTWQAGVVLLPVKSVGVMGDERTYENPVALRAVHSTDGMTAEWVHLPYELLAEISNKIINEVKGINRVVYDISTKPPATIEWE